MHFTSFIPLLAGLSSLAAAAPSASKILADDDIILLGDNGRHEVMKVRDYDLLKARSVPPPTWGNSTFPTLDRRLSNFTSPFPLSRRQDCEQSQEVQLKEKTQFQNWDVPMSSVITAEADRARVTVSDGFSLANSVTVSTGVKSTFEKVLSVSLGVDVGTTWTTEQTAEYSFFVPKGKSGIIVSNPDTTRYTGQILDGCTDNPTRVDFTVDAYTSTTYGALSWVKGTIRLCSSDTYPVPFCVGTGTHS
ncbi:hypothetical protein UCRNP2_2657 [Neofusicoccum parvum UCRNP2]|uniref:Celp0028 effector like protein n=2 Tax=Neofusicoccum parvum TaxID=310453 RepID=R1GQP1_BOTPV|nr:hypothetical protein UCRNP2_2657 [Neofusicoccum parvum UCRNP2]GME28820.1 hypothetical protein GTA08_BOTSDO07966 [Neofusicoccum parvum]